MKRIGALARATAFEIVSDPLSLLLMTATLAVTVFSPAFHYHQFGESTRMARDAGLSALLFGGLAFAVFGTLRTLRREIETGTLSMALAYPVSRTGFLLGKFAGSVLAFAFFALVVCAATQTSVTGAEIGGRLAAENGDIARIWGPSHAIGVATLVAPHLIAAVLNRFASWRYVPSVFMLTALFALSGALYRFDPALAGRLVPAELLLMMPVVVFTAFTTAVAVRLRANQSASAAGLLLILFLPAIGNHWLSDALSRGGTIPAGYVWAAFAVTLPIVLAFLLAGIRLFSNRDIA